MTVLYWIKNERVWKQYVKHRVSEISQLIKKEHWRFCLGAENPADFATRGLSVAELCNNSLWWHRPKFLEFSETEWRRSPTISSIGESTSIELVRKSTPSDSFTCEQRGL